MSRALISKLFFFISQRCILLSYRPVTNKWYWAFFHELVWKYLILQHVEYKDHELSLHKMFNSELLIHIANPKKRIHLSVNCYQAKLFQIHQCAMAFRPEMTFRPEMSFQPEMAIWQEMTRIELVRFILARMAFNIINSVESSLASNPKMDYQVFLCIFH